jgi:retinol dehydrogenase 12
MPDLDGKTFIVTGSNTGIGRVTAIELAKRGADVVLACRSEEKTREVIDEIRGLTGREGSATFLPLDLSSLESVEAAAKQFLATGKPLHGLINNAGLAGLRGTTKEGFELTFGVNHLGHFLFTKRLLPRLKESAPSRIVNVSSKSHYDAKALDVSILKQPTSHITGLPEYAVSKLCNVLFTKELAKRLTGSGVRSYALHPGVVASDAWRQIPWPARSLMKMFMISNDEGAKTTLYCATSPEVADQDGLYYDKSKERRPSKLALDEGLATKLWEESERMLAEHGH